MTILSSRVPQVGVLADLSVLPAKKAQVSEYRDLWHPTTSFAVSVKP